MKVGSRGGQGLLGTAGRPERPLLFRLSDESPFIYPSDRLACHHEKEAGSSLGQGGRGGGGLLEASE